MRRRPNIAGEEGVTLIELVTAISILLIILPVMTFSITESLDRTMSTKRTLTQSNLVEFTARYFGPDVQSAPTAPNIDTPQPCGTGNAVVSMAASDGSTDKIVYATLTVGVGNPNTSLYRRVCEADDVTQTSERRLGTTSKMFVTPTCLPDVTSCRTLTLTLTWPPTPPPPPSQSHSVTLRADRRPT